MLSSFWKIFFIRIGRNNVSGYFNLPFLCEERWTCYHRFKGTSILFLTCLFVSAALSFIFCRDLGSPTSILRVLHMLRILGLYLWYVINIFSQLFKTLFIFRERGRKAEREGSTDQSPFARALKPGYVPQPGVEPATFRGMMPEQLSHTGQGFSQLFFFFF